MNQNLKTSPAKNDAKPKETKVKNFIWFGNDADGLSIIDFLAAGMFIFFLLAKIAHFILSIAYIRDVELIQQMNLMMADINQNTYVVITGYFVKKSIDTTVTKVGLFRSGEYEKVITQAQEQYNTQLTETNSDEATDMTQYEVYSEDTSDV